MNKTVEQMCDSAQDAALEWGRELLAAKTEVQRLHGWHLERTKFTEGVINERDRLRSINAELVGALECCEELLAVICEVICKGNPPPHGTERLAQTRAVLAKARATEGGS